MNSWPIRWASDIEASVCFTHEAAEITTPAAEAPASEDALGDGAAAAVEADGRGTEPAADAAGVAGASPHAAETNRSIASQAGSIRRGIVTVTSGRIVPRWPWPCVQTLPPLRGDAPCDRQRAATRRAIRPPTS